MSIRFQKLPKIELHVHLDCSMSFDAVHLLDAGISHSDYQRRFVAPQEATGLPDYLNCALEEIRLMQTGAQLRIATLDVLRQFQADHVLYAEIRFAPLEHLRGGLSPEEVVAHVEAALREGMAETGVEARLILCTLRHYSEAQSLLVAELACAFQKDLVAGFDLAADEAAWPLEPHIRAFAYAQAHGLPCTAHAGEVCGPESVRETLKKLRPQRIGHGVRSIGDPDLLSVLKSHHIHLEVCPTSNIRTRVFPSLSKHSVHALYEAGISLGINTDGRTISSVSLTEEYAHLHHTFGWSETHFLRCNLNALQAAFIPDVLKARLRTILEAGYPLALSLFISHFFAKWPFFNIIVFFT